MCNTKCTHKYRDASATYVAPKHIFIVSSVCQECYHAEHFIFHDSDCPTAYDAIGAVLNNTHLIPDVIGYTM